MEVVFPSSLGVPVMKLLQEIQGEPNDIQRRINQTIHLQQTREEVYHQIPSCARKIKKIFDKRTKAEDFYIGDKVLNGIQEEKTKENMGNLISYGKALISFMLTEVIMLFS
jgi:hypothetical protein